MPNSPPNLNIAIGQLNTQIGAISDNISKMESLTRKAKKRGADLILFPECAILGYPPRDLLTRESLIRDQLSALHGLAQLSTDDFAIITGYVDFNDDSIGKPLRNGAAFCRGGKVEQKAYKQLLPTYDVFEEERYFEPGKGSQVVEFQNHRIGLSICEDAWHHKKIMGRQLYRKDPIAEQAEGGVNIFVNLSASPFYIDKQSERTDLLSDHAQKHGTWLYYVNHVGGQDELVFDGRSMVIGPEGKKRNSLESFESDFAVFEPNDLAKPSSEETHGRIENIFEAVTTGLKDYFDKTGFDKAVVGISGGIDSAVTAAIGAEALGAQNLLGISMPTRYTSTRSVTDAQRLANFLGIRFRERPIEGLFDSFRQDLSDDLDVSEDSVTTENIQARIRGSMLMAFSNAEDRLLLATGNKSELAVGYSTLYGDMCGAISPLGDSPKRYVYELARWLNETADTDKIPQNILQKAPSAELRHDQTDQDDLPPYDTIDDILEGYVQKGLSLDEIARETGHSRQTVHDIINRIQRNEFKRRQAAPALKITPKAFGMGWRYPLSAKYAEIL